MDSTAVLVVWLVRLTATHVPPFYRFHLGPVDRQQLYSLTAQPGIRAAQEFNELSVQRRDPIKGVCLPTNLPLPSSLSQMQSNSFRVWCPVCTSDVEPSIDLVNLGTGVSPG